MHSGASLAPTISIMNLRHCPQSKDFLGQLWTNSQFMEILVFRLVNHTYDPISIIFMGHRKNLKYFPFPDTTLRWGRNIGKTEYFIWVSSSCRSRVARSRIRKCEETPIDQRVMNKSFHHSHNTVLVGSQYLHDILTSGSEVPLDSTDLHCFYKHSGKPEWNLHNKSTKVRITRNSNNFIHNWHSPKENAIVYFAICIHRNSFTFSGNFSRLMEASKQSPKSIWRIFPLHIPVRGSEHEVSNLGFNVCNIFLFSK